MFIVDSFTLAGVLSAIIVLAVIVSVCKLL